MGVWGWVLVGVAGAIGLATVVAFAVARILGQIARDVTELLEHEEWSSAPLTRTLEEPSETEQLADSPKADSPQRRA
jgi:hypothetical protein